MPVRINVIDPDQVELRGVRYSRTQLDEEFNRLAASCPGHRVTYERWIKGSNIPISVVRALHGDFSSFTRARMPEYVVKGTSTLRDSQGNLTARWEKTRLRGREESEVVQLPDPKRIVKESRLYDQEGRVVQQWVSTKADEAQRELLWRAAADELAKSIIYRVDPSPVLDTPVYANRCVIIPVGDHHIGMWSSALEGSGEWTLEQAETVLMDSIDELLASTAPSQQCVLTTMGDWFHFDSLTAKTPRHGHSLDASGRYVDMVRAGIRMLRRCIDRCLQRHHQVHLIISAGNHDEASSVFLREALANVYELEPRLSIDRSPKAVHVYEWGQNLLAIHHGDTIKTDRLPLVIAADHAEMWGRTSHRLVLTGHVHHRSSKEHPGCHVETLGVLAPRDHYAESHGYRSDRSLIAIVLHPVRGEVARHTCRIDTLKEAA